MTDKTMTGFNSGLYTEMILINWFEYYFPSAAKFDCWVPQVSESV